ncbi:SixA phosphatase family protein [Aquimarina sp. 2201CG14-23]|uniref:SixA phosphatase family protein n=1 Tax=Aquimarina mycalae TaxID=3040073 RepID=UPI0024781C94|nr:phosphoglycerate mutase family protein [Aquimarina sp. 2201CG14-23]MDH7448292.1 phosphoglycerate mutase family protein [Aquimarina sp. 2201CG14-23]
MKSILLSLFIGIISFSCVGQETTENQNTTTYILVRHSEKDLSDASNRNPNLTEEGKKRSENLASILTDIQVDYVFSTNYKRTIQTATPIAKVKNLEITPYDPRNLYSKEFQEQTKGKTAIIVGHSNTTPTFVNKIIGKKKYSDINEKDYSKVFIIKITGNVITDMVLNIN